VYDFETIESSILTTIGYNTSDTVWMRMKVFNGSHFEDFQFTFNLSSDYMLEERIRSDNWMEIISSFDSHQGYSRLTQETNFHDLGICTRFNMDFLSGKILS